ncbi:hypothetical protein [Agromyces sp. Marseille-Q5079]|uniref:hypothetical protein n=1 Tax=Agromyces sp. Marseille-Q5079 TaxID=3439059 RepID=UPI003D9CB0D2
MSGALSDAHDDTGASTGAATDRPTFELRARVVETVVLVASVVVLRMLGVLLMVASSNTPGSLEMVIPLIAMSLDPNVLVWIALVCAVQFGLRSMGRPGRWALIVLAAPVAAVVVNAVRGIPSLADQGLGALFGSVVAWIDAGVLTLVVAFTAAVLGRERRTSSRIAGVLLALGGLLTMLLVWQWIAANLSIWATRPPPTPEQENLYVVTATLTLGALVGAIVFAAISRRRGLIISSCIVGCLGLVITFAVPVPADRFAPEPAPAPTERGGGHSCMSPGDPNCVGG